MDTVTNKKLNFFSGKLYFVTYVPYSGSSLEIDGVSSKQGWIPQRRLQSVTLLIRD